MSEDVVVLLKVLGYFVYAIILSIVLSWGVEKLPIWKAEKRYGKRSVIAYGKFNAASNSDYLADEKCEVICLKSGIVVESEDYEISIANEKLMDISVWKEPVRKEYYDDVTGAIAGAAAGGAIGAIIGGVGVRKTGGETYFTIKFISDEGIETIAFDVTKYNIAKARKIARKYRWLKQKQKILNKNKKKTRIEM